MTTIRGVYVKFLRGVKRRNEMKVVMLTGIAEGRGASGRHEENMMDAVTRVARGHLMPTELLQLTRDKAGSAPLFPKSGKGCGFIKPLHDQSM